MSDRSTAKPFEDAHSYRTLGAAARAFFSHRGPRLIAAKVAAAWLERAFAGPPTLKELPVAAAVFAWWPFQEWLAHKHLLHFEPREMGGQRVDPLVARAHRTHHEEPRDVAFILLPVEVLAAAIPINAALWHLICRDRRVAATGMASYATAALLYEWTHFLVHTGYAPRGRFFARVRRNHRNHHYRNEAYWLGFTWPDVDRWLGTEPDPKSVPRSATARNLHGLSEA
jgi:hypothetical protein